MREMRGNIESIESKGEGDCDIQVEKLTELDSGGGGGWVGVHPKWG